MTKKEVLFFVKEIDFSEKLKGNQPEKTKQVKNLL